jgi:hypothetical protein
MCTPREAAVSEIVGALLLVTMLMTGLTIITVMLLSIPPPSSSLKAVLGVKCSYCPNLNPTQYDILIDHEGGQIVDLSGLRVSVIKNNSAMIIDPVNNITLFPRISDPNGKPPYACDGVTGDTWPGANGTLSTGKSLKFSYIGGVSELPTTILVQEPSSFGYSTVSQLRVSYVRNITSPNTGTGYIVLNNTDPVMFDMVPYVSSVSSWSADGCDVEFGYKNTGQSTREFAYGNRLQSMWNFLEPVEGFYSTWELNGTPKSSFEPEMSGAVAVRITKFKGKVVYNLGSMSTRQVTCLAY